MFFVEEKKNLFRVPEPGWRRWREPRGGGAAAPAPRGPARQVGRWQRPKAARGKQEAAAELSRSKATGANRLWS